MREAASTDTGVRSWGPSPGGPRCRPDTRNPLSNSKQALVCPWPTHTPREAGGWQSSPLKPASPWQGRKAGGAGWDRSPKTCFPPRRPDFQRPGYAQAGPKGCSLTCWGKPGGQCPELSGELVPCLGANERPLMVSVPAARAWSQSLPAGWKGTGTHPSPIRAPGGLSEYPGTGW